jgi:hypothetical protein
MLDCALSMICFVETLGQNGPFSLDVTTLAVKSSSLNRFDPDIVG